MSADVRPISSISDAEEIDALRAVVEGTSGTTGTEFFEELVRHLARAIDVRHALVAELAEQKTRVRTLAVWDRDHLDSNIEYDVGGTPCKDVVNGSLCHYPDHVANTFPNDQALVEMGIRSYLGVPLTDHENNVLGHLAVFDERPMPEEPRRLFIFRIFAARAAAELLRLRLDLQLSESERRYRDLFEQAPIPYVYEDTETRFVSVNEAAMKLLGLRPEDVPGTVGMSLVADNPANRRQLDRAFEDIRLGRERGLVELELHRKDNGQPVWVQFWSRPEPDGKHTRTMIIDITQRVLAEREKARLQSQNAYLQEEINSSLNFDEIVGRSTALAAVLDHVRAVAPTDASVLITGETGTGKELIARAIHSSGRRKGKPLIKVNCAALPAGLIESELFGHEKGSFTGAISRRIGRFELADGGTIFLDEIGDLPIEMQAKLLRVLQEQELERIGGERPVAIDVRVIAATNRDLKQAIVEKTFREDLYYRLNVFPIHLPALRERKGDIPLLAKYFAGHFAAQFARTLDGIEPESLRLLSEYDWPGNIRELQNIIERAAILSRGSQLVVDPEFLGVGTRRNSGEAALPSSSTPAPVNTNLVAGSDSPGGTNGSLDHVERDHILSVLEKTGWRIDGPRGAAIILGINPNTLRSRMKKLGIKRP
ncbi:MAG: sigma 54-interacting transcriptional regulator [Pirellulaceae bacterium]